jgi:hypothetical protein
MPVKRKQGNKDGTRSVKVSAETYVKLQTLIGKIARDGWNSLGLKRSDRASMDAVVDAAIDYLQGRA